jgi:hypothetical protein
MELSKVGASVLFAAVATLSTSNASATVLNYSGPITTAIGAFGYSATIPEISTTYGQTITVGSQHVLNNFSLYLDQNPDRTMNLRGYVAGWDGGKATSILYTSPTVGVEAGSGIHEFKFNTGHLNLAFGEQYVFFLSVADLGPQQYAAYAMPSPGEVYDGGSFVYYYSNFVGAPDRNNLNLAELMTNNWYSAIDPIVRFPDAAFKATFSNDVPEPSSISLIVLAIAGFAFARRRKA